MSQQQRRQISQQDLPNQSADKYYRSANKSVIQRSIADSKLTDPHRLIPIGTPAAVNPRGPAVSRDLPRTADVYYANQKKQTQAPIQGGTAAVMQAPPAQPGPSVLVIANSSEVVAKMKTAVEWVKAGCAPVRVVLASRNLVSAARMKVEYAVTHEEISEDQGRDIVIGLTPEAARITPKAAAPAAAPEIVDAAAESAARLAVRQQELASQARQTEAEPLKPVAAKAAPVQAVVPVKEEEDMGDGDGD